MFAKGGRAGIGRGLRIAVAIVGIGQTHHKKRRGDVSIAGLVREAAQRALEDANMDWGDIDAVVLSHAHIDHIGGIVGEDGKPLFKCHGGCEQHDVFEAIKNYGLLPDLEPRPEPLSSLKPIQTTLEQEWHYTDEDGVTQFIKQRYKTNDHKGKTYKLLKVDNEGRRHTTMLGANIVPYNLPALEEARELNKVVFLTEGEKAADALTSIGMTATTTHAYALPSPTCSLSSTSSTRNTGHEGQGTHRVPTQRG